MTAGCEKTRRMSSVEQQDHLDTSLSFFPYHSRTGLTSVRLVDINLFDTQHSQRCPTNKLLLSRAPAEVS